MIPTGVPWPILIILAPVEILQYVIVRPFTLAVRLFANMFAGHILLLVFTLATWYLLTLSVGLLFSATSFILTVALTGFEMLIQALQAYIFTILTAQYIGGSLEAGHLDDLRPDWNAGRAGNGADFPFEPPGDIRRLDRKGTHTCLTSHISLLLRRKSSASTSARSPMALLLSVPASVSA